MNEIRLVILGEGGVGKSAITIQFLQNHFIEIYDPTIEDSYRKQIAIDNHAYFIEIIDTAGQDEYTAMSEKYIRTGDGFVLVYDITKRRSFDKLFSYVAQIKRNRLKENIPMVMCGNKCDVKTMRSIYPEEALEMAETLKCSFYECSARLYINIDEMWHDVIRQVIRMKFKNQEVKKNPKRCNIL